MESFAQLVKTRRSMRKFNDQLIDADDVATILKAALMSPSSKGKHAWQFVVVDDAAMLGQLATCKTVGSDFLAGASLAIVVIGEPQESDVWIEDCAVATTVMLYQAEDLGLGACWIQLRERFAPDGTPSAEVVRELLGIPADLQPLTIVALGHKGMERKPFNEERLLWEKVHLHLFEN